MSAGGTVPIGATFPCAACGGTSIVVLLPPHAPDPRFPPGADDPLGVVGFAQDEWRLSIDGPMQLMIGPIRAHAAVADALRAGDPEALAAIDPEYASFWCRRCGAVYCRQHLPGVAEFDDGFYDATYATCPEGHRVVLDD